MTKSSIAILVFVLLVFACLPISAVDFSGGKTINSAITQIRAELSVSMTSDIDPSRVSDRSLAQLGEAIINSSIPDRGIHDTMHVIMGSTQIDGLYVAHVFLGYNFLKYPSFWKKDYGISAFAGSGWGMHSLESDRTLIAFK